MTDEKDLLAANPPRLLDVLVVLVPGSEEVVEDKISHVTTQLLAGGFVEAEMLSGEDATQCRFFRGRRKARE